METSDSDLRPALTTTKLCSMRTTSAVMTSPGRISVRCRDSSKRAAKDSDIEFPCSQTGCTDATCAVCSELAVTVCGVAAVGLNNPRRQCASCTEGAAWTGLNRGSAVLALPPDQHLFHRGSDGQLRVVELQGILCGLQRRHAAGHVPGVARFQVSAKTINISRKTL